MAKQSNRYKIMERYLTYALIISATMFLLYLIFAAVGIIWLKIIVALCAFGISGFCLYCLYINKELLRQRSLWMTSSAASIILCTLISLLLNYPSA